MLELGYFLDLKIYGFDQHSMKWMESYLQGRTQLVNIQGQSSSTQEMPLGTPQGSRLSPLLFVCLMADLDLWAEESFLSQYADDTQRVHMLFRDHLPRPSF